MWVTIYFRSGKIIETLIQSFGELDKLYNEEEILQIDVGCTMDDENREKQQELLKLKIKLYKSEKERLNGQGLSLKDIREKLKNDVL